MEGPLRRPFPSSLTTRPPQRKSRSGRASIRMPGDWRRDPPGVWGGSFPAGSGRPADLLCASKGDCTPDRPWSRAPLRGGSTAAFHPYSLLEHRRRGRAEPVLCGATGLCSSRAAAAARLPHRLGPSSLCRPGPPTARRSYSNSRLPPKRRQSAHPRALTRGLLRSAYRRYRRDEPEGTSA
jgi:hypothetical protein